MKLIGSGGADMAFTQVDTAVDAVNGRDKFPKKLPIPRACRDVPEPDAGEHARRQRRHQVRGYEGKRVSTGAPAAARRSSPSA